MPNARETARPGVQSCIDGQCRERIAIRMAGASERPLRRPSTVTPGSRPPARELPGHLRRRPCPGTTPPGAQGHDLTGFLRWGQRDLRMSVLATADQVANSALFLQTRELPEWWLGKTCRCDFGSGASELRRAERPRLGAAAESAARLAQRSQNDRRKALPGRRSAP